MKVERITVTEAARNFAECVNRAHYQGTTFVLLKNGKPVARIVPDSVRGRTGKELAEALSEIEAKLTPEESAAWQKDLEDAHKALRPPIDEPD